MSAARLIRAAPALAWAVLIALISHREKLPQTTLSFEGLDKLVHALVYAILALLCLFAAGWPRTLKAMFSVWFLATCYGLSDEIHQMFVPGRSADVWDLVADSAGALFAVAMTLKRQERFQHDRPLQAP